MCTGCCLLNVCRKGIKTFNHNTRGSDEGRSLGLQAKSGLRYGVRPQGWRDQFRALAALEEGLGSILGTHMGTHNHL